MSSIFRAGLPLCQNLAVCLRTTLSDLVTFWNLTSLCSPVTILELSGFEQARDSRMTRFNMEADWAHRIIHMFPLLCHLTYFLPPICPTVHLVSKSRPPLPWTLGSSTTCKNDKFSHTVLDLWIYQTWFTVMFVGANIYEQLKKISIGTVLWNLMYYNIIVRWIIILSYIVTKCHRSICSIISYDVM